MTMSETNIKKESVLYVTFDLLGGGGVRKTKKESKDEKTASNKREFLRFMMEKKLKEVKSESSGIAPIELAKKTIAELKQNAGQNNKLIEIYVKTMSREKLKKVTDASEALGKSTEDAVKNMCKLFINPVWDPWEKMQEERTQVMEALKGVPQHLR